MNHKYYLKQLAMEKKNYVLKKTCFILCSLLGALFVLSSCSDVKLAKSLDGTWHGVIKGYFPEVGAVEEKQTLIFKYDEDEVTGGTFTEIGSCSITEESVDLGVPLDLSYTAVCKCTGTWDITLADLSLVYNASSLVVDIKDLSLSLSSNATFQDKFAFQYAGGEKAIIKSLEQEGFIEAMKKEFSAAMYEIYVEQNKSGGVYKDVKVEGGLLTFVTEEGVQRFKSQTLVEIYEAAKKIEERQQTSRK